MPLTLVIKNYHNGGGDLTLDLKTAVTSEKKRLVKKLRKMWGDGGYRGQVVE